MHEVRCKHELTDVSPLRSALEDSAIPFHRLGHCAALGNCHAHRLFAVHVLAGPSRQTSRRRMPVIAGSDQYSVDIVSRQQLPQVYIGIAVGIAVMPVDCFLGEFARDCL